MIDDLLWQLENQADGRNREQAAILLGKTGDARAIGPLCRALLDENVSFAARDALISLGAAAVAMLIASIPGAPYSVRERLTEALVKIGQPALNPLIAALDNPCVDVRKTAVRALADIKDRRALEPLCTALADKDRGVRWQAAHAMGWFGDQRAIVPLTQALRDSDLGVGKAAAKALTHLGPPEDPQAQAWYWVAKDEWEKAVSLGELALEPLCAALKDLDEKRRVEAVKSLARMGASGLEPILSRLDDNSDSVPQAAVMALGEIGDPLAVEALCSMIAEKNRKWELRRATADALKKIGDPRARESLEDVIRELIEPYENRWKPIDFERDGRTSLLWAAASALEVFEKPVDPLLQAWYWVVKKDWPKAVSLGTLAVRPLCLCLGALADKELRTAAAALVKLDPWKHDREFMETVFGHRKKEVRQTLVMALGESGNPQAVEILLVACLDEDYAVRHAAEDALLAKGAEVLDHLIMALQDHFKFIRSHEDCSLDPWEYIFSGRVRKNPYDGFRRRIAGMLGKIGDSRAAEPLCQALKDRSADLRQAAAEALGKIAIPADPQSLAWYWIARQDWDQVGASGHLALKPLCILLTDAKSDIRRHAVLTLGKIVGKAADEGVVPLLCRTMLCHTLKDTEENVRQAAALTLGGIYERTDDLQVQNLLCNALMDPDEKVRQAAAEALEKVGLPSNQAIQAAYWVAKKDWVRAVAAGAYAVEPLCALLKNDYWRSDDAIMALGKIGDARAVGPLCAVMEIAFSSGVAAEALVKIGKPAVPALIKLLQSNNLMTRVYAAQALGKINDPSAIEPLLLVLKNSREGRVRSAAIKALEAMKSDNLN